MTKQPPVPSSPADTPDPGSAERPVFAPYDAPAGGWGALHATARALREQSVEIRGTRALLSMNQPDCFDCPQSRLGVRCSSGVVLCLRRATVE